MFNPNVVLWVGQNISENPLSICLSSTKHAVAIKEPITLPPINTTIEIPIPILKHFPLTRQQGSKRERTFANQTIARISKIDFGLIFDQKCQKVAKK